MAKKPSGPKPTAEKPERGASLREETPATRSNAPRSKPSALLDTRVVYCGDNLEQAGRMQKEEGRMIKPAHFPILNSSFLISP
jgi:hypothetical protein